MKCLLVYPKDHKAWRPPVYSPDAFNQTSRKGWLPATACVVVTNFQPKRLTCRQLGLADGRAGHTPDCKQPGVAQGMVTRHGLTGYNVWRARYMLFIAVAGIRYIKSNM